MRLLGAAILVTIASCFVAWAESHVTERYSACTGGDGAWIEKACYGASLKTPQYRHDILGGVPEWTTLRVFYGAEAQSAADRTRSIGEIVLRSNHIFEDVAPRLFDIDGDGRLEIVVVESSFERGARLAVYAATPEPRFLAATDYIGTRHRWLAPAAIGDLDGDGRIEIAYVDRPHLARTLRVVRYEPGSRRLTQIAAAEGHTNHRIGDRDILGGLRTCGGAPGIVTATPDWSRLLATRFDGARLTTRDIGPNSGPGSVERALACR